MAGELSLFIDVEQKKLVTSFYNTAEFVLPPFMQGETVALQIFPVKRVSPASISAPHSYVSLSGATVKVGICGGTGTPTGTQSDPTPTVIAFQDSFSAITNGFSGTLDLNTSDVASFLGSEASKASTFEIEITPSAGTPKKYIQVPCTIKAAVIESTSTVPTPLPLYYTKNEVDAGFVKKIGGNGDSIELRSENGTWGVIIRLTNDGVLEMNPFQL